MCTPLGSGWSSHDALLSVDDADRVERARGVGATGAGRADSLAPDGPLRARAVQPGSHAAAGTGGQQRALQRLHQCLGQRQPAPAPAASQQYKFAYRYFIYIITRLYVATTQCHSIN